MRGTETPTPSRVRSPTRSLIVVIVPSQLVLADPESVGRQAHGLEDLLVARAAAQVARERLAHQRVGGFGLLFEEVGDGDDEPGRAEPALDGSGLDERLLDRMQRIAGGHPLDRPHLPLVGLRREYEARAHQLSVEPDRTRSALPLLAGVLRPGQAQVFPEEIEQAGTRPDVGLTPLAVHVRADEHQPASRRSSIAHASARLAITA